MTSKPFVKRKQRGRAFQSNQGAVFRKRRIPRRTSAALGSALAARWLLETPTEEKF